MTKQLERFGVNMMEAGFPAFSQGDFASVRAIAHSIKNASITGLARAKSLISNCLGSFKRGARAETSYFSGYLPNPHAIFADKSPEEVTE